MDKTIEALKSQIGYKGCWNCVNQIKEVKMIWIVTYWDLGQEPVVTPFNNRENAEKCWAYFKEIHDGCCLDECKVFSTFLTPNERIVL